MEPLSFVQYTRMHLLKLDESIVYNYDVVGKRAQFLQAGLAEKL